MLMLNRDPNHIQARTSTPVVANNLDRSGSTKPIERLVRPMLSPFFMW